MDVPIACICPPVDGQMRHPGGDIVTLRDRLPFHEALAVRNDVGVAAISDPDATEGDILATLTEAYLVHGIESWTLADDGGPIPATKAAIRERLLASLDAALAVGEAADELYAEAVMLPLLARASNSSRPTPTDASISQTNVSHRPAQRRRSRSSTTTTRTDAIARTTSSPAGASS